MSTALLLSQIRAPLPDNVSPPYWVLVGNSDLPTGTITAPTDLNLVIFAQAIDEE